MAKEPTKMAQEAAAERAYIASQADWDKAPGQEYGGQADILQINIGEIAGPFEYMGHQPMVMEGGKSVTVHIASDPTGEQVRLPIAASFLRAVDQADLFRGDKFLIRRSENVKKKSGIGRGQDMQIYAIKPTVRAPRPQPVAAAA